MLKQPKVSAIGAAVFIAIGTFAAAAQAQTAAPQQIERVEVTGSRILSVNAVSSAPIQVMTSADIAASGVTNLQELLTKSPLFVAGNSRTNSNFQTSGAGVSTIDLRGMGTQRTLVLVNGRRFVSGVPGSSDVDLNTIPTDFIERVETLTGGSSATYGSDAISGVINIVLKKGFEGLTVNAQTGRTTEGDGTKQILSGTMGANLANGKGNVMIHGAYTKEGAVYARDRGWATDEISTGAGVTGEAADLFAVTAPFFSSFAPQGRFFYKDAAGANKNYTYDAAGKEIPFSTNGPAGDGVGATGFNRQAYRAIAVPTDRFLLAAKGDYALSDEHTAFFEGTYAATKTRSNIEPYPLDSININKASGGLIPAEFMVGGVKMRNPMVPDYLYSRATDRDGDGLKDYNFTRRMSDFGGRTSGAERDTFRALAGLKGDLTKSWSYEAFASYGFTKEGQTGSGQVNVLNFRNALEAVPDVNDVNGNGNRTEAICMDANARAQGCVPANIFGANTLSPAAVKYINAPSSMNTKITQKVVGASVSGEAFELPAGPLGVAAGAEWREESSDQTFDALTQAGLNAGNALPNTAGKFDVSEAFVEVKAPLLKNLPLVKSLDASAAVRVGKYSSVGNVTSWTGGLDWAVNSMFRVRANTASSTRAPTVGELFAAPAQTFPSGISDPCAGTTLTGTSAKDVACRANAGVAANMAANGGKFTLNQADKQGMSGYDSGNPNLKAEKGQSTTLGFVITPKDIAVLKNVAITVDYFDIKVTDAIGSPGRTFTLNQCYGGGDQSYCKFVVRRQANAGSNSAGSLEYVNQTQENSGGLGTRGIDLTTAYAENFGPGRLDARLAYTYLIRGYYVPRPGADIDYSTAEVGSARNKWAFNLGYTWGNFGVKTTTSFIGESRLDDQFMADFPDATPDQSKISSKTYFDLQGTYTMKKMQVYLGVDNLFNTKPPSIPSGVTGNTTGTRTNATTYDVLGSRYYVGLRFTM
ncbi:TonB-dependent receptor domain-containing protein [Roseateles oligotrophus]|uniref:TonB-dependent receptor n=1 Tax=Roseateles oligotrophus TaxID=1769250 RepID=A0ABT2YJM0_9BURK|nr:TonB-dependent receptor [Roseateles oligotrophus]MCV2370266.1 TonB-dependent receptor [Roseateles oligotrophus]